MIKVRLTEGCLSIKGHSGTARYGQDLVCAAVSILAETLAGVLKGEEVTLGQGLAEFRFSQMTPEIRFVLRGLSLLQQAYPRAVSIKTEGDFWRDCGLLCSGGEK